MQSEHIEERINSFGGKLYLEFGGKLFDDYHVSRVLPGFEPDSKIRMLTQLKDRAEIIIVVSAAAIEQNKIRGDLGITLRYGHAPSHRRIQRKRAYRFRRCHLLITHPSPQPTVLSKRLNNLGVRAYKHYPIPGYPSNPQLIVSDDGYGKNDYIETTRPLVVITAPRSGSGKMATCLSQLYHDHKRAA